MKTSCLQNLTWKLLTDPDSLTLKLAALTAGQIQFQLLSADWGMAEPEECNHLNLNLSDRIWIRNIKWLYQNETWVMARVLVPSSTLMGPGQLLKTLGDQSLGKILWTDPDLQRHIFEINHLTPTQEKPYIWSRRSIFHFHQRPLLITEMFSPDLFNYLNQNKNDDKSA